MNTASLASATTLRLHVTGMTCASCVRRVEKTLQAVPGVDEASVNLATEEATVSARGPLETEAVAAAVRKAGYDVATKRTTLNVSAMTCASCVARVEKALLKLPGVSRASVNLATEQASVETLSTVPLGALIAAVEKAGHAARATDTEPAKPARLPAWWPAAISPGRRLRTREDRGAAARARREPRELISACRA